MRERWRYTMFSAARAQPDCYNDSKDADACAEDVGLAIDLFSQDLPLLEDCLVHPVYSIGIECVIFRFESNTRAARPSQLICRIQFDSRKF
ncbi:hypothetical protein EVAR_77686_1 [Eumeta japonica]|uniref:Uncharacterized protein n=1 Tax=Eumeta variegata TaxID=151549 RepID=A0A4C1SAB1_EUMVA|nr:hypothetical protein EVAR_77686_1 [Eumeta japonica]